MGSGLYLLGLEGKTAGENFDYMLNKKIIISAVLMLVGLSVAITKNNAFAITSGGTVGPDLGVAYPAQAGLSDIDPRVTTAKLVRTALSLLGTVFLVIVLYGGYLWMTAGGNEDRVGDAKKWIFSGVIGLAIILSAFGITTFVLDRLTAATI